MMVASLHLRHVCPVCGSRAKRVHREPLDYLAGLFGWTRRYECSRCGCGWGGLLGRYDVGVPRGAARLAGLPQLNGPASFRPRVPDGVRFLSGFIGSIVAFFAIGWAGGVWRPLPVGITPDRSAPMQALAAEPGYSNEGLPLAADDPRAGDGTAPLALRRLCSWGTRGFNPYGARSCRRCSQPDCPPMWLQSLQTRSRRAG